MGNGCHCINPFTIFYAKEIDRKDQALQEDGDAQELLLETERQN